MAYKLEKSITSGKLSFYQNKNTKNVKIDTEEVTETIQNDNENNSDPENDQTVEQSAKDYINVIKKVKKDNITIDNISEIMLCQIPGISTVTAKAIIEKYNTLPILIKALETNEECLKNISYTNTKGQIRKVNKTCIVNIVKFLLKK